MLVSTRLNFYFTNNPREFHEKITIYTNFSMLSIILCTR